jgi:serine O-acetyltransferase
MSDLEHMAALWGLPRHRRALKGLAKVLLHPRVRAVLWFRVAQRFWREPMLRPLALLIQGHVIKVSGAELHPGASIGPGFGLVHSVGVVIGRDVVAGSGLSMYQNTTLGHGRMPGQPALGHRVRVYAGASVLGGVTVGDDAVIAAGAVVVDDVPPAHTAAGAPARVRPRSDI